MTLLLLVLVILLCVGGLPAWGYHSYGYAPLGAQICKERARLACDRTRPTYPPLQDKVGVVRPPSSLWDFY